MTSGENTANILLQRLVREVTKLWTGQPSEIKKVATARFIGGLVARIIIARRKQGLSQKDLADKMRVPIYKVTEMENLDAAVIDACVLVQAALVLGVEI